MRGDSRDRGVAYTEGLRLDDAHKEIHLNLNYVQNFKDKPTQCRQEIIGKLSPRCAASDDEHECSRYDLFVMEKPIITFSILGVTFLLHGCLTIAANHPMYAGIVTHEMVHCYQYSSGAPGGLIEGIADFVRLKASLAPPHWKGPKGELGEKWDAGYQKTAYFLDYLEEQHGSGTVGKINDVLRTKAYDEKHFWEGIFGKGMNVDVLWKAYRDSLDGDDLSPKTVESKEQESETKGPGPQGVVPQDVVHTDTDEDDETVLVRREDMPKGMGGSLRRRWSSRRTVHLLSG